MRRFLISLVVLVSLAALLGGCIVPVHRGGPTRGRGRCYTSCGSWGHRTTCVRRCSVYRNGYCVRYRQVCSRKRYCRRNVTRCR